MFIVFGKKAFYAIFALLLVLTAATVSLLLPPEAVETSVSAPTGKTVWVIAAGHGGEDGGAVAADGSKESDMILAIARRRDALLIFLGEETRMTRTEDISIHDASASTLREKKRSDLENRVGLVNSTQGAILVSIHQNSLPAHPSVHGAQVFYNGAASGPRLGETVQAALNGAVNAGNGKTAKAIDRNIYLMKNVQCPAILVECGFLSNRTETGQLLTGGYQLKLAVCIAAGFLDGKGLSSLKGALMSRGTREVARLIQAMGGSQLSAYGLCHLGDYEATVFSRYSHNRQFGESFIRGETYTDLAVGYYTVEALVLLG